MEKIILKEIENAAKIIKNGGVVVFPTETVYGIGVDCLNEEAIKKLYKIKNRPFTQKTSILVGSIDMLYQYTQNISKIENELVRKFFPGPLTLVLHKKRIPDLLTNNEEIVGFRMPQNDIALKLIQEVGRPIATTSANISREPSSTSIEGAMLQFGENVDFYIDGGKARIGIGSTVVQVIENVPHIIRKGSITNEQINEVISKCLLK